ASLIKILEEEGIGRPSTYAPTIRTIIFRDYIRRESRSLVPSELGIVVNDLLIDSFPDVLDIKFTAKMEEELDRVEQGALGWQELLKGFYEPFAKELEAAKIKMRDVKKEVIMTDKVCEKCGKPMVIKWSKYGKFLSCSGFPECKNAKSIDTGIKCPNEGCDGMLVMRRSKRGRVFYGCTKYPECNFITNKLPEE
ncbi:MAG: topoisomerase DNA-binding C4 zinc finger domain-containing protein, partial [Candidatus Omnitrophica bacterium]|nr:topoisomerase DNA-binding C4 zinc finger domain-containing protein [Candidatus Omnitrophota bacterium]